MRATPRHFTPPEVLALPNAYPVNVAHSDSPVIITHFNPPLNLEIYNTDMTYYTAADCESEGLKVKVGRLHWFQK